MAVQVLIDTAVRHCEDCNLVAGVGTSPLLWSFATYLILWAFVVGMLVGVIHVRDRVFAWASGRVHVRVCASHRR